MTVGLMAINFPKNREEAGLGSGPLQNGDSWLNNSVTYTWVVSANDQGAWSSRGINVDPESFIDKSDQFGGQVTGTYDNISIDIQPLTLQFIDDQGNVTTNTWNGSEATTFTFADTDDATSVVQLNEGIGIDITANNTINIKDGVARRNGDYVVDGDDNYLKTKDSDDSARLGGRSASSYALKSDIPTVSGNQDFQSVLDQDLPGNIEVDIDQYELQFNSSTDSVVKFNASRGTVNCKTGNNSVKLIANENESKLEITGVSPYIDFKRFDGINNDYEVRVQQLGLDILLDAPYGRVMVRDKDGAFQITRGGGSDGGGGNVTIAGVSSVNVTDPTNNPITVSPTTGSVRLGWRGLNLGQLENVSSASPSTGQALRWSGTQWEPQNLPTIDNGGGSDVTFLNDLRDVDTSGSTTGKVLTYTGSGWEPRTPETIDIDVPERDPADYGASHFWSDLRKNASSDSEAFEDFRDIVNSASSTPTLYLDVGYDSDKNITLTRPIIFSKPFGLIGKVSALGKGLPTIIFDHDSNRGFVAEKGMRAQYVNFEGGEKGNASRSPTVLIFIGQNGTNNEDDIDASFKNCEFGNVVGTNATTGLARCLHFNGRNVNVGNCNFSNCKHSVGIFLEWNNIQLDDNSGRDAAVETSWRKNRIYNNQYHCNDKNVFIRLNGDHPIAGLAITDNIIDTGPSLFEMRGGGCNGLVISGNSWYGGTAPDYARKGAIQFDNGFIYGATITGNTFSGFYRDPVNTKDPNGNASTTPADRPDNFISVDTVINGLAITGNTFSFSNNRAISIPNNPERVAVTGNCLYSTGGMPGNVAGYDTNVIN